MTGRAEKALVGAVSLNSRLRNPHSQWGIAPSSISNRIMARHSKLLILSSFAFFSQISAFCRNLYDIFMTFARANKFVHDGRPPRVKKLIFVTWKQQLAPPWTFSAGGRFSNLQPPVPIARACLDTCEPIEQGLRLGDLAWPGPVPTSRGCAR